MHRRLSFAVVASLVVGTSLPASALEPVGSASPSVRPAVCPNTLEDGGECLGPLAPGTYRTTVFDAPFTVTVPDGWANYEDLPGNFLLVPPGSTLEGVNAGTGDYIGIYQGVAVEEGTCEPIPEPGVGSSAAAMAEAFAARDGLSVSAPVPVEVGGLRGLVIDIQSDAASDAGCQVPDLPFPIIPLIIGTGPASLEHSQGGGFFATRLYLLDDGDTNVVIEVSDVPSASGSPDDYLGVIDSIDFETTTG